MIDTQYIFLDKWDLHFLNMGLILFLENFKSLRAYFQSPGFYQYFKQERISHKINHFFRMAYLR